MGRTFWTVVLAVPLVLVTGVAVRSTVHHNHVADERAQLIKTLWRGTLDVVCAGDSRAHQGFAPAAMRERLPGLAIGNFGFPSCRFTPAYMAAVRATLKSAGARRAVVLGISAHALTRTEEKDEFIQESTRPRHEVLARLAMGDFLEFFAPVDVGLFAGTGQPGFARERHADGWFATRVSSPVPHSWPPDGPLYGGAKVDPRTVADMADAIRRFTAEGIRVVALRMPLPKKGAEREEREMGLDERALARAVEEAGGRWVPVDLPAHRTYDGSHLDRDSAWSFSRDVVAPAVARSF
jgi:hypothetical protein